MSGIQVTNEELSLAAEAGRRRMATEFRAGSVRYDPARDAIELTMVDGWGLVFLRSAVAELADIPSQDMGKLDISPAGTGLMLDDHDVHINVHGLVTGFISPHLMASTLGRKGGSASSDAKARSSRENGRKGGRPGKSKVA